MIYVKKINKKTEHFSSVFLLINEYASKQSRSIPKVVYSMSVPQDNQEVPQKLYIQ